MSPFDRKSGFRYLLPGAEIAMGLPAYQEEFEEFAKTLPEPAPAAPSIMQAERSADEALRHLTTVTHRFWSDMIIRVAEYRAIVERSTSLDGELALRFAVDHGVPYLVAHIDRVIASLRRGRMSTIRPEKYPPGPARNSAKRYAKRHREIFDRYLPRLEILRDAALSIAWDFDPEARGGEAFENADDLIAFLNR